MTCTAHARSGEATDGSVVIVRYIDYNVQVLAITCKHHMHIFGYRFYLMTTFPGGSQTKLCLRLYYIIATQIA